MKDQKATCLNNLKQLITKIIDYDYNKNYYQFVRENSSWDKFVEKYASTLNNQKRINTSMLLQKDYSKMISSLEKDYVDKHKDEIKVHHIISNDIQFISIHDININVLNSSNRKIYDEAIQIINHQYNHNNVFIGMKNDDLVRIIRDKKGNVKSWVVKNKGRLVSNKNNKGTNEELSILDTKGNNLSNILILSFIIGSFIGIIFLSLYVKFMK